MPRTFIPPSECPVCGEPVPQGAKVCPECGADENSGWDDDATRYDGLDLPDAAFDDEREQVPVRRKPVDRVWLALAVLLLFALVMTFLFR